jgi:5-(carboxyamino)imidazole ribonucleotide synthase
VETSVGIIGDGQLGMLLCEAAPALGLRTVMLTSAADCPAARRADRAVEGAMDDPAAIDALIDACDVITYEREDIPPAAVARLREAQARGAVTCYPRLETIELLQDKGRQKTFLANSGLATLPFMLCDGSRGALDEAVQSLGYPLVQKALRGGFDGRGVQLLRDAASLDEAWPGATLCERFAGEFREVAVLVARAIDGSCTHFGPVDMTFEDEYAVLDTVSAPAALDADAAAAATALAHAAVQALDGVGVFGVEMFLLAGGEVLINEISPRVHNAGHYTLEACASSQFEQHLRAVTGMPLADSTLRSPAAMRNLLATPALRAGECTMPAGRSQDKHGSSVYWYGKSPARLMRKLGHVTALADSAQQALALAAASWDTIQRSAHGP